MGSKTISIIFDKGTQKKLLPLHLVKETNVKKYKHHG